MAVYAMNTNRAFIVKNEPDRNRKLPQEIKDRNRWIREHTTCINETKVTNPKGVSDDKGRV